MRYYDAYFKYDEREDYFKSNVNKIVREVFNKIINEEGIKITHVAKKINMNYSNLLNWKNDKRDFGLQNLGIIVQYCKTFNLDNYVDVSKVQESIDQALEESKRNINRQQGELQ